MKAALAGVAAETGVVMLVYLDEAYERRIREGRMATAQDLREAIMEGAVQRVRPKMMTVAAIMGGLLPIMWTTGTGANENGICYQGKLFKVMEDLKWDYDPNHWDRSWHIKSMHTDVIDLTLTPFLVRDTTLSLGLLATGGACAFGNYNGTIQFDGKELIIKNIVGWAEEFNHRW